MQTTPYTTQPAITLPNHFANSPINSNQSLSPNLNNNPINLTNPSTTQPHTTHTQPISIPTNSNLALSIEKLAGSASDQFASLSFGLPKIGSAPIEMLIRELRLFSPSSLSMNSPIGGESTLQSFLQLVQLVNHREHNSQMMPHSFRSLEQLISHQVNKFEQLLSSFQERARDLLSSKLPLSLIEEIPSHFSSTFLFSHSLQELARVPMTPIQLTQLNEELIQQPNTNRYPTKPRPVPLEEQKKNASNKKRHAHQSSIIRQLLEKLQAVLRQLRSIR